MSRYAFGDLPNINNSWDLTFKVGQYLQDHLVHPLVLKKLNLTELRENNLHNITRGARKSSGIWTQGPVSANPVPFPLYTVACC